MAGRGRAWEGGRAPKLGISAIYKPGTFLMLSGSQGASFTAGAVFGRKLYDGRSQPQVVDLGKSATCLGKACVSAKTQIALGNHAALRQTENRGTK